MLVFLVLYLSKQLQPLSTMRPSRRREKKPPASIRGKTAEKIMVPTSVLPMTLYHDCSKSLCRPPVSPKEKGYSLRSALTSSSKKAVLKNWTRKVTLVISSSCYVSVG